MSSNANFHTVCNQLTINASTYAAILLNRSDVKSWNFLCFELEKLSKFLTKGLIVVTTTDFFFVLILNVFLFHFLTENRIRDGERRITTAHEENHCFRGRLKHYSMVACFLSSFRTEKTGCWNRRTDRERLMWSAKNCVLLSALNDLFSKTNGYEYVRS